MSIFARSLASYWLSTVLTLGLAGFLLTSTGLVGDDRTREVPLERLQACARAIIDDLPQRSVSKAGAKMAADASCPVQFLIGPDGKQLIGKKLPADLAHLLKRQAEAGDTPLIQLQYDGTVIAFAVPYPRGAYRAVAILPLVHSAFPNFFWLHISIGICISGLVFWLLARQFSKPILSLQRVAEGVTNANLSIRPSRELLERKDELGDLSRSINAMFGRIGDLMSSQKAFLAQVSHELGSPLTRLNLALALARRKAGPELAPELNRLEYEARELNSMIQQLLLLARLENATEHDHETQRFSIAQLVEEVVDDARFEARQNGKGVSMLFTDEAQWHQVEILGYRDLLKRALDNVLRNAIRFTSDAGLVEIECCASSEGLIRLCIRDHGQGVPSEQVEAIFEPFVRLASQGHPSGAGLGLAIAKQAVLSHGGTVVASNAEPHGLLVTIRLPAAPEDSSHSAMPAHYAGAAPSQSLSLAEPPRVAS